MSEPSSQPSRQSKTRLVKAAEIGLIGASISFSLLALLSIDWLYSKQQKRDPFSLPAPTSNGRGLYISKPSGWYELNPNYNGEDRYGSFLIRVKTDSQGFRTPIHRTESIKRSTHQGSNPTLLFLGDSFTYGVGTDWEQSFVGQIAKRYNGTVINGGVVSHSPTPHLYRLKHLLDKGSLPAGTIVIMAVDISDVQDEASRWVQTSAEPFERNTKTASAIVNRQGAAAQAMSSERQTSPFFSPRNFHLTHRIYFGLEALYKKLFDHWQIRNSERSAFTHRPWSELDSRYQPLGVKGGLFQLQMQIKKAAQLSKAFNHPFWILIYPWPAQLAYADRFSWEQFIQNSCEPGVCSGVINAFPVFRNKVGSNRMGAHWQQQLYLEGDMHFSAAGNALIAEAVLQRLQPKASP